MTEQETDLRYPIGRVADQPNSASTYEDAAVKQQRIIDIRMAPGLLEHAVLNLDEAQLDTPYRAGGWTVRQVVHHVADSHMNAYMRFKHGLTEDSPTIKTYDENLWAELKDTAICPINISLTLLHALHLRWYAILDNMTSADWQRTIYHPEKKRLLTLWDLLAIYSWHGKHHAAHITSLRQRMGW